MLRHLSTGPGGDRVRPLSRSGASGSNCGAEDWDDEDDDDVAAARARGAARLRSNGVSGANGEGGGGELPPFHLAFPVHDLEAARSFYGPDGALGLTEGRRAAHWQDYSLFGHQIVCHEVGREYRAADYYNHVDADDVPVPHFGVVLSVADWQALAARLKRHGVAFVMEPTLRWPGEKGAQWTMFFRDPSGNSLEFKAMVNPTNLFAKYDVDAQA